MDSGEYSHNIRVIHHCQQIFDPNHRTERTAGGRPSGGTYESNPRVEMVLSKPATIQ